MKNTVKLNEAQLRNLIAESVKKVLRESSVAVRGTETKSFVEPQDGKYPWAAPLGYSNKENEFIEKYGEAVAQRIDYALRKKGINAHVKVSEDIENDTVLDIYGRILKLSIRIGVSRGKRRSRVLQVAVPVIRKILDVMSMVEDYDMDINDYMFPDDAYINIEAQVKPDKNGMTQIEKSPWYQTNSNEKRQTVSNYNPFRYPYEGDWFFGVELF